MKEEENGGERSGGNFMQRQIEALVATRGGSGGVVVGRRQREEGQTEGRTARRSFSVLTPRAGSLSLSSLLE